MSAESGKVTYTPPQLKVYGDVREITRAVGNTGTDDGATRGNSKTQP